VTKVTIPGCVSKYSVYWSNYPLAYKIAYEANILDANSTFYY